MPVPHESHLADDPLIGRQLANFRLERPLGQGGMAQVYYGWDVKLQRPVAIKVIDARYRGNPAYAERFVREAQTIARWRHEHIINIYYADDEDGLYFFAMEYIDGPDLGQLLAQYTAKGQLMPQAEVLRIGRAVAGALDYAHGQGVIHRDVKPSNVMVANDGRVVLTDFGLAMDVQQGSLGEIFGSARYIAPEQARDSAAAVPQSDLYALGIMLYEMLTGVVPFDDPSPTAAAVQHMTALPPPPREINPDLNQRTEAVLLKALSKSPRLRFQTGSELIGALEKALLGGPSAAADQTTSLPLPEAALYMGTELAQPMPLPPVTPPTSQRPDLPPPPPLAGSPAAPGPVAGSISQNLLLAVTGLSLIGLMVCALVGFLLYYQRGSRSEAASPGGQSPPAVITATATLPPTATPVDTFPTLVTPPTQTPTPTNTPPAVVLLTLTPTSTPIPTDTPTPTAPPTATPTLALPTAPPTETPTVPVPTDTPTLELPPATPAETPTVPAPTDTPVSELPTPTPVVPSSYNLLIARRGEDSLFVVNQSEGAFPLAPLRLENRIGAITGTEWGIELLDSGACVTVWRNDNDPKPPKVECAAAGERLTRREGRRFWERAFRIHYNEQLVGICNQNQCQVTIPQ
ncbi:MAG: serine/threonine protein kinase [Anaerolineae bacterium]|nr:serine/threonine protein kinase [Anaerolineae bacterium]